MLFTRPYILRNYNSYSHSHQTDYHIWHIYYNGNNKKPHSDYLDSTHYIHPLGDYLGLYDVPEKVHIVPSI